MLRLNDCYPASVTHTKAGPAAIECVYSAYRGLERPIMAPSTVKQRTCFIQIPQRGGI